MFKKIRLPQKKNDRVLTTACDPCKLEGRNFALKAFIGVETAALTFRTKQYNTSYSSHICYCKRSYNDFFSNHNTTGLVRNCLKLLSCVVIKTALDGMKKSQLS